MEVELDHSAALAGEMQRILSRARCMPWSDNGGSGGRGAIVGVEKCRCMYDTARRRDEWYRLRLADKYLSWHLDVDFNFAAPASSIFKLPKAVYCGEIDA